MAVRLNASGEGLFRTASLPGLTCTLMGWFYFATDRDAFVNCLAYGDEATTQYVNLGARWQSTSDSFLELWDGTDAVVGTINTVVTTWTHLALTLSGASGTALGYLNGALQITNSGMHASISNEILWIGNDADNEWMDGRVAAIKIYSAVLSAAEIATEMRYFTPRRRANLFGWYPCVHPTVATNTTDLSGNGTTLTASGTLTVEDGPPIVWAPRHRHVWRAPSAPAGRASKNTHPWSLGVELGMGIGMPTT